ncbi:hypothetical protein FNV43_RR08634 [Rhamnella rubrinervis]|uniref:Uncharacterized protein n=1 Tax=Rhamnella rubrinervis TaxID=2594499 RepID=A0A8K0H8P1_9ROSA|nr:hypothetical protein FNV43_RR08634 [Rhamnella rubrinervis]
MARYHLLPDLKPLAPTQVHRLLPKSPSVLRRNLFLTPFSFYVGSTFKGAPREQQALLELEETATRLKREKETLRNTLKYLTATSAVKDVLETLRLGTKGGKAKNAEPADEVLRKAQALFLDRLSELVNASSLQKIHHFSLLVVGLEEKDKWWKEVPDQGLCRSGGFAQVYKAYVNNNPGEVVALNVMSNYIAFVA